MPPPLPLELFAPLHPAVQAYIRALEAIVAQIPKLEARVAELEAQLKLNSRNSSKPPSSDGPHVKPAPPRIPSGRKRGGQPGHTRHERVILPPDEVVDHKPPRCNRCCTKLTGDDPDPIIDQIIDLPEKMRHVIHHRRHTLCCPECQARTTAAPVPEAACGFGPKLTAVTAYCSGMARMSKRTIERFLDHALWDHVLAAVDRWPRAHLRDAQHVERVRFVLRFLYHTALRAAEAANAKVNDLIVRRSRWWLRVSGRVVVELRNMARCKSSMFPGGMYQSSA